jgi:hypothetical protein
MSKRITPLAVLPVVLLLSVTTWAQSSSGAMSPDSSAPGSSSPQKQASHRKPHKSQSGGDSNATSGTPDASGNPRTSPGGGGGAGGHGDSGAGGTATGTVTGAAGGGGGK